MTIFNYINLHFSQRLTLKTVTAKSADIAKNALTVVPISWFYIPVELSTSENHVPEIDFTPEALTYYMEEVCILITFFFCRTG